MLGARGDPKGRGLGVLTVGGLGHNSKRAKGTYRGRARGTHRAQRVDGNRGGRVRCTLNEGGGG